MALLDNRHVASGDATAGVAPFLRTGSERFGGETMDHAGINGVEIAYEVMGAGEPALFIHGAHIADALQPLVEHRALDGFQRIRYHRRGIGASSRPPETSPTSISVQAADAIGLLNRLEVERAHIVGHSLGGSIALELAARHPARVASLALLEPALLTVASGAAFAELVAPIVERYHVGETESAVHDFLTLVGDAGWQGAIERSVPRGITQAVKDAATFFDSDLPALSEWTFGPEQAAAITRPVLSVLGSATSPMFTEGRDLLHQWFPQCQDADVAGATHLLQMEAPDPVATAVAAFLANTCGRSGRHQAAAEPTS
jgi:pimeloyl-ACP methyl ester carboxylesterase